LNGNYQLGDVIFVRGHSWISKLISLFDGEFSHVCFAVSDTHIIESQRFVKSRITKLKYDDYEIFRMNLSNKQCEILKSAIIHCGVNYDYKQLIVIGLRKILGSIIPRYNSKNKYICSELVELILTNVGEIPINESIGEKSPNELFYYLKNRTLR
jgi:hypothetical protein